MNDHAWSPSKTVLQGYNEGQRGNVLYKLYSGKRVRKMFIGLEL